MLPPNKKVLLWLIALGLIFLAFIFHPAWPRKQVIDLTAVLSPNYLLNLNYWGEALTPSWRVWLENLQLVPSSQPLLKALNSQPLSYARYASSEELAVLGTASKLQEINELLLTAGWQTKVFANYLWADKASDPLPSSESANYLVVEVENKARLKISPAFWQIDLTDNPWLKQLQTVLLPISQSSEQVNLDLAQNANWLKLSIKPEKFDFQNDSSLDDLLVYLPRNTSLAIGWQANWLPTNASWQTKIQPALDPWLSQARLDFGFLNNLTGQKIFAVNPNGWQLITRNENFPVLSAWLKANTGILAGQKKTIILPDQSRATEIVVNPQLNQVQSTTNQAWQKFSVSNSDIGLYKNDNTLILAKNFNYRQFAGDLSLLTGQHCQTSKITTLFFWRNLASNNNLKKVSALSNNYQQLLYCFEN